MAVTVIFIRHGEKAYKNGLGPVGACRHDPGLKDNAETAIIAHGTALIARYGEPIYVVTSPYLRCRQTAQHLTSTCKGKVKTTHHCDVRIAEYLGNQHPYLEGTKLKTNPDVTTETAAYGVLPPLEEKGADLNARCRAHLDSLFFPKDLREGGDPHTETVSGKGAIWVVTHGLVIGTLYKHLSKTYSHINYVESPWGVHDGPKELEGFVLQGHYGKSGVIFPLTV